MNVKTSLRWKEAYLVVWSSFIVHPACWAAITAFAKGMNLLRLECGTGFIAAKSVMFPCLLDEAAEWWPLDLDALLSGSVKFSVELHENSLSRFLLAVGGANQEGTNELLEISLLDGLSRERFKETKWAESSLRNAFTGAPSTPAIPKATRLR